MTTLRLSCCRQRMWTEVDGVRWAGAKDDAVWTWEDIG